MFNSADELVAGEALYYGCGCTHNKAKAVACWALHAKLSKLVKPGETVLVGGDLALVMEFLTGVNKPTKASLMAVMKETKSLVKRAWL